MWGFFASNKNLKQMCSFNCISSPNAFLFTVCIFNVFSFKGTVRYNPNKLFPLLSDKHGFQITFYLYFLLA